MVARIRKEAVEVGGEKGLETYFIGKAHSTW